MPCTLTADQLQTARDNSDECEHLAGLVAARDHYFKCLERASAVVADPTASAEKRTNAENAVRAAEHCYADAQNAARAARPDVFN